MTAREFQFDVKHSEPASIRGHKGEFVVLETEKDTIEHVTGLVRRNGIGRFAQAVAQVFLTNRHNLRILKFRQRRKLFLRQSKNFEEALPASDGRGVLSIDIELNSAGRQLTNNVEKATRRERGRALLFHLSFETTPHPHVKIGCSEMNFVAVCLQQNIGKDWKSRAGADYVLDLLQALKQLFFRDIEFHDGKERLRCKAFNFVRQP